MNIVKQIKVFFAALALLAVMIVPNAQAQHVDANQIQMLGNAAYIYGMSNVRPSIFNVGFTNANLASLGIPVGQLAGHYADGTLITDYRDLLPFVGQSLEVVDANGETVAGMDQMGLYVVDPATSNAVAISVSNGVLSVGGTTLGTVTDTDEQSLSLDVTTLNIDRGTGVDLGTVFVTGTELMTLSNTFNMAISEVSDSVTSTSNTLASSITTVSNNVESVSNTLAASVSTLETTIIQGGVTNTVVTLADADGGGGVSEVTVSNGVILVDGMAVDTDTQLSEADVDNFVSDNGYLTEIDLSTVTNTVVTLADEEGGGVTSEITVSNGVLLVDGMAVDTTIPDTDDQTLTLTNTTLGIVDGNTVDLGTTFATSSDLATVSNNVESVSNTLAASVSTLETTILQGGVTNTVVTLADADGGGGVSEVTVSNGVILVDGMAVDTDTQLSEADVDNFVSDNGYLTEMDLSNLTNTVVTLEHAEGGGATSEITVSNGVLLVDGMAVDTTIPDTDDQTLTLTNTTLEIVDGNSVDLGATFATDQEVTDAINNAVGGDFQSDGSVSMTGDLNMGGNCITNTPCFWLTDPETGESVLFEFREGMIYIGGTPITPTAKAQQSISLESFTYFDAGSTNALDLVSGKTSTSDYEFQVVSNAMLTGSSTVSWTTNYTAFALRARALGDADYYTSPWVTAMYDLAEIGLEFPLGESKLTVAGGAANDDFGRAISMDGDTLVVGAYRSDAQGTDSGAAYVFTRSGAGWTLQAQLTGLDTAAGHRFGGSVSVHEDTVVVGAYGIGGSSGAAYVFTRSGTTWTQQQKLTASDAAGGDSFGYSAELHQDTVVVGAYRNTDQGTDTGSAYVFTRSGTTWTQQQKLTALDAAAASRFGFSVSVHEDTIAVGASLDDEIGSDTGAAYVFTRSGTTWTQQQKLTALDGAASDNLGYSVSVHDDTLATGAYRSDEIGTDSGSAYVFTRSGTTWTQEAELTGLDTAASDNFGFAISVRGHTLAVGAFNGDGQVADSGAAYVFTRNGTTWTQQEKLTASDGAVDDGFGVSVSVGQTAVAVGMPYEDDGAISNTGAVYVFE